MDQPRLLRKLLIAFRTACEVERGLMEQLRPPRKLLVGCHAVVVLTGALGVALVWILWTAASRITIDPDAFNGAIHTSIVETLKDGPPDQKIQLIHALRDAGPAAVDYVPELTAALRDEEPDVRTAAEEALKKIDPAAAALAGIN